MIFGVRDALLAAVERALRRQRAAVSSLSRLHDRGPCILGAVKSFRTSQPWPGVLVAVAVVLASLPALQGTWVYDDRLTASSDRQDGWDDLGAVFSRDASDYFEADVTWSSGVTYRPLAMGSLILVQAVDRDIPLLHHLLSLLMHLTCALCLYVACKHAGAGPRASLLIVSAFALHPVTIESYGYINGRSDVLAGAFLAALASVLPFDGRRATRARIACSALFAAGAALSKEPAVVAALAMLIAASLPEVGRLTRSRLRALLPSLLAGSTGLGAALALRWWVTRGQPSGAASLLRDPQLLPRFAQLLSLAVEHVAVPLPRSMLSLAFELSQPVRLVDWAVLAVFAAIALLLLVKRRFRQLVLLTSALACLVLVLPVSRMLWLGFDRYLYLPLLLASLAIAPAASFVPRPRRDLVIGGAACAILLLAVSSFATSRAYASHRVWLKSLIDSRPDDPSGYLLTARFFLDVDDVARTRESLLRTPRQRLSPALAHELFTLFMLVGEARVAVGVAEQAYRGDPRDAFTLLDALAARAMQGHFKDVERLADELAKNHPLQCRAALHMLDKWLRSPDLSDTAKRELEQIIARVHCL